VIGYQPIAISFQLLSMLRSLREVAAMQQESYITSASQLAERLSAAIYFDNFSL
jgi:hypothetical protein